MSILSNPHTHTTYCDGHATAREMVEAAIQKGFTSLGFSSHSYTAFDESYAMSPGGMGRYIREIRGLQEEYKGKLDILLGVEWDYYGQIDREDYDFIIGSVHYIKSPLTECHYTIDYTPEELELCLEEGFNGNVMAMLSNYYETVTDMAVNRKPTILGHFDLIRKLNRDGRFFDENSSAYLHLASQAIEKAAAAGCVLEVNTGGVYRGYCSTPYPAEALLRLFCKLGGKVIISSDAHDTEALDFHFDETAAMLADIGFKQVQILTSKGFVPQKI